MPKTAVFKGFLKKERFYGELYNKAYETMARLHDASKGAYKRPLSKSFMGKM